jgi:predicted glycosyltransferase
MQLRVLIFSHDGTGLGHLRRLSRIAQRLQDSCTVLFVTGHRDASWLVPKACEYVHLPSRDRLSRQVSAQWDRQPFWSEAGGLEFRAALLQTTVAVFQPHAILVDHLPLGQREELLSLFESNEAKLYYVVRGVLDTAQRVRQSVLTDTARRVLGSRFDRILVAADQTVIDVASEYNLEPELAQKITYCGYVMDRVSDSEANGIRVRRGIPAGKKWVVCSAGGGREGEELVEQCLAIATELPDVFFDIVVGPKSRSRLESGVLSEKRVLLTPMDTSLPLMHAACDVLVCCAGYNTLLEAYVGNARIICRPIAHSYEQVNNATRFGAKFPISLVHDYAAVPGELMRLLSEQGKPKRDYIDIDGASKISSVVIGDLFHSVREL